MTDKKHADYDKHFEPATAILAEGALIGLATCKHCHATILIDPRDKINRPQHHANVCQRQLVEKVLRDAEKWRTLKVRLYNTGYHAGHEDTVEGGYTDVYPVDIDNYHSDRVAEWESEQ